MKAFQCVRSRFVGCPRSKPSPALARGETWLGRPNAQDLKLRMSNATFGAAIGLNLRARLSRGESEDEMGCRTRGKNWKYQRLLLVGIDANQIGHQLENFVLGVLVQ